MQAVVDLIITILILLNFRLLGTSRLAACINTVAWQAVMLGLFALLTDHRGGLLLAAMVLGATAIKAGVLPWLVRRAMRETGVAREVEPHVGFTVSILIGAGMLALSFFAMRPLQAAVAAPMRLLIPVTLFTMLTGLFLIVSRKKAITQILGFLTMENGIYLFGIAFAVHEPFLVQLGVLLDVFAAVFVMGITVCHINREFDHIDIDRLTNLKD